MAGNLKLSIFLIIGVFFCETSFGVTVKVKPEKGDGIHTLLKRYDLHSNPCDRDSFLELNDLNDRDFLHLHKTYILPLKVLEFDGRSIRSTMDMDDYDRALRIQNYNDSMHARGLKPQDFRKDKELWVPYREYYCDYMEKPAETVFKPFVMTFPIFGPDYEEVEIISEKLRGCVYYLVSGHGGPDPGAMSSKGDHQLCEDEYAYDVTVRAARNLLAHGAKVYMIIRDPDDGIRDDIYLNPDHDEICWPDQPIPLNQIARLKQRTEAINRLYQENKSARLQRVIIIHVDSRTVGQKIDVFFYHFPGSKTGEDLANTVLDTFRDNYSLHQKNRDYTGVVKPRDLWMLRESHPSAIYLELGNITNSYDQRRLLVVNNRQAIANWLTEGLMKEAATR